jgi:hypothetical protein
VSAQHFKLDGTERNDPVQKVVTFLFGIADVPNYGDWPRIWRAPSDRL